MSRVNDIIDDVLGRERGFVDHPNDKGGPTNHGITLIVARANGWEGRMEDLPKDFARNIYFERYITEPKFDLILRISEKVGEELIDTGVNMGPGVAAIFFQRWLNGFNAQQRLYGDLFVDGRIGKISAATFRTYLEKRGSDAEDVMYAALNGIQASRYLDLAERNQTQEDFLYGWVRMRVLGRA